MSDNQNNEDNQYNYDYEYKNEDNGNNTGQETQEVTTKIRVDLCAGKEKKRIKNANRIIIFATCDGNRRYDEVAHILMPIYTYLKGELGIYEKTFLFIGNLLQATRTNSDLSTLGQENIDKIIKENKENYQKFKQNGELNKELSDKGYITIFHAEDAPWNLETVKSKITKDTAIFLFGHGGPGVMQRKNFNTGIEIENEATKTKIKKKEPRNFELSYFPTTGRESIDRDYLYTLANDLSSNQIVTVVNMCYGGLFVDDLQYVPKNLHIFTNNECGTAGLDNFSTNKFLKLFDYTSDPLKFINVATEQNLKLSSHFPCSYIEKEYDGGSRKKYRKTYRKTKQKKNKKRKSLKRR